MFHPSDVRGIQQMVTQVTGYRYAGAVSAARGEKLLVEGDAEAVKIIAPTKPALARGFFRFFQELKEGKASVSLEERARFASCGCHVDFSRNAVMTVEACKRFIDRIAALGMNLIVLYTEDTYTVPEYPRHGYLRGRLTQEELRELDEYAASLEVELMPCIQTLGHMEQFLQWCDQQHLMDQPEVLLADEEETYRLIEAQIRAIRRCVRGKRLHIGMDEAHGVGLGQYYAKHGPTDRFALLGRHLQRVVDICRRYDFQPIMWSDMFFRLGSKNNEYYDMQADIPQEVVDRIPGVDMCYWDYYHDTPEMYEHMLTEHAKMGESTVFAGGVWTWSGFLPQVERTWATMEPALRSCARHGVKTVFATMWGDDGQETNHALALSQAPIFSEFCWRGEGCTRAEIQAVGEFLTGIPREAYEAFGLFYPGPADERPGKALVYCDLLYPLGPEKKELEASIERSRRAIAVLEKHAQLQECDYALSLFRLIEHKAELLREIRERYHAGDRAWMENLARTEIPALLAQYEALRQRHKALWERDHKRNGWEVLALRYGAVKGRLEDVQESILRWVSGELPQLCEMEEEPMPAVRKWGSQSYSVHVTPMINL